MPAAILAIIDLAVAAFSRLMASQVGRWALQILLFFGISFAANKITSGAVTPGLQSAFNGTGADVIAWISYLNVDRALTLILSAYGTVAATRWTIKRTPKA